MAFTVYPNPTREIINIKFSQHIANIGRIEVYNAVGQEVYEITKVIFDKIRVDLPIMIPGVYWIKVGSQTKKLIVL